MRRIKPFARQGFFTAIDNSIFDEVMPTLSLPAWKVLCFIIRKTIGYQKDVDFISYSQIRKGTGIKSNESVRRALMELRGYVPDKNENQKTFWRRDFEKPELILAKAGQGREEPNTYCLNTNCEIYPVVERRRKTTDYDL